MTNIDWRAFWTSFATIIIALLVYLIVLEPLAKKYKIRIVDPGCGCGDKTPTPAPVAKK